MVEDRPYIFQALCVLYEQHSLITLLSHKWEHWSFVQSHTWIVYIRSERETQARLTHCLGSRIWTWASVTLLSSGSSSSSQLPYASTLNFLNCIFESLYFKCLFTLFTSAFLLLCYLSCSGTKPVKQVWSRNLCVQLPSA